MKKSRYWLLSPGLLRQQPATPVGAVRTCNTPGPPAPPACVQEYLFGSDAEEFNGRVSGGVHEAPIPAAGSGQPHSLIRIHELGTFFTPCFWYDEQVRCCGWEALGRCDGQRQSLQWRRHRQRLAMQCIQRPAAQRRPRWCGCRASFDPRLQCHKRMARMQRLGTVPVHLAGYHLYRGSWWGNTGNAASSDGIAE